MKLIHPDGESIILSDSLLWRDEFDWSNLAQTEPERTLSGAYIVQQGIKQSGRPITLEPPDDSMAWHKRQITEKLQAWAMQPETKFTLVMAQGTFNVIFDNAHGAVSAKPVLGFGGTQQDDYFLVSIKLITA
ncbi:hypothetical protein [Wielerella bovis]|uniref:hypothetical protein n=1 Tax=Wielerella bovis TaxID=2917790 RepID=UPI002019EEA2|nr:hypothetical protein [Wielerella bovis]MCG7657120.1 hypothetical protein [Wielerella bovis]MCG7659343.1 hypothetical protein [Wielerella bovis]